jgi:hypothetical protein
MQYHHVAIRDGDCIVSQVRPRRQNYGLVAQPILPLRKELTQLVLQPPLRVQPELPRRGGIGAIQPTCGGLGFALLPVLGHTQGINPGG